MHVQERCTAIPPAERETAASAYHTMHKVSKQLDRTLILQMTQVDGATAVAGW